MRSKHWHFWALSLVVVGACQASEQNSENEATAGDETTDAGAMSAEAGSGGREATAGGGSSGSGGSSAGTSGGGGSSGGTTSEAPPDAGPPPQAGADSGPEEGNDGGGEAPEGNDCTGAGNFCISANQPCENRVLSVACGDLNVTYCCADPQDGGIEEPGDPGEPLDPEGLVSCQYFTPDLGGGCLCNLSQGGVLYQSLCADDVSPCACFRNGVEVNTTATNLCVDYQVDFDEACGFDP